MLAVGAAGPPAVPFSFESPVKSGGLKARGGIPSQQLLHSSEWHRFHEIEKGDRVLVVGAKDAPSQELRTAKRASILLALAADLCRFIV